MLVISEEEIKTSALIELIWAARVARIKNAWPNEEIQLPPRGTDTHQVSAPDPKGQSWLVVRWLRENNNTATNGCILLAVLLPPIRKVNLLLSKTSLNNPPTVASTNIPCATPTEH